MPDVLTAALRQHERMEQELALTADDVASLAQVLTGDRTQPSGRWGSTREMLAYLTEHVREHR